MKIMNVMLSCDDRMAKYISALQASLYENHREIFEKAFRNAEDAVNEFWRIAADSGKRSCSEQCICKVYEQLFSAYGKLFRKTV